MKPFTDEIVILRSSNRDMATFELDKRSNITAELKAHYGDAFRAPRISLAHGSEQDKTAILRSSVPSIVSLLTGVRLEDISSLTNVRFQDPVTLEPVPVYGTTIEENDRRY